MTQLQQLNRCWLIPREPPCIVQLGRTGDLLQLFPAFKLMAERDGEKPVVMVSDEYAGVFDGISYAQPWVVKYRWWNDTAKAKQLAMGHYSHVIIPQYWNDNDGVPESEASETRLRFTAHGHTWAVEGETQDYGTCMWNRLGFTRVQMLSEPLVIDRRDKDREEELVKNHVRSLKPVLLFNFTGVCSPFGYVPEMMRLLRNFQSRFQLVDLGLIRARRIYDLLGLYDIAAGLITIDTATAHLANASAVPAIWFTVDSTGESIPRGNVALHVKYPETPKRFGEISDVITKWYGNTTAC